jgi:DNA-binding CsgD family transcriptional regulator
MHQTLRPLSPRERQVVAFARLGRSSKSIAYELGLADSTVRVLLRRARMKLGLAAREDWSRLEMGPAPIPYHVADAATAMVPIESAG